jgi:hypothetical protein
MTIQDILTEAGHSGQYDNRNRAVKQLNALLKNNTVKIILVPTGFIRQTKNGFKWNIRVSGFGKATQFKMPNGSTVEPIDVLTTVGRFLSRDDVKELSKAEIKMPVKCAKCNGTGYLPQFAWYAQGVCFDCLGSGFTSLEVSVEINKKLSPAELIREFREHKDQPSFKGLTKVRSLKNESHLTAAHWLFEDKDFYYIGQPMCQNETAFKVCKTKFEDFKKNYNKSHFPRMMGVI